MALNDTLQIDLAQARRDVARFSQEITQALSLDPDTEQLRSEIEAAIAPLVDLEGTTITVGAEVDGAEEVEALSEALDVIDGADTTASVSVEGASESTGALDLLGASADGASESTDKAGSSAEALSGKLKDQLPAGAQQAVSALEKINPAAGLAVAGLAALVVVGNQVIAAQNDIQIATGATGAALDGLVESATRIQDEVPASLAAAAQQVGTLNTFLGVTGPLLEGLSEGILDASRLLGEEAGPNAQNFAQVLNLFSIEAQDGVENLDLLFAATQKYGIGLGELLGTLESSGSVFRAVGFDLEESVNLIGQFNLAGLNAGQVTGALTQLIARAEDTGRSFEETLGDLVVGIKSAATEQEAFAIGIESFGTRAGVGFASAIRNGIVDLETLSGALGDTSGLVAQTAADTETAGQSLRQVFNDILIAVQPLALEAAEFVEVVVGGFAAAVEFLGPNLTQVALAAAAATLAFNPLVGAIVGVAVGLDQLVGPGVDFAAGIDEATSALDAFIETSQRFDSARGIDAFLGRLDGSIADSIRTLAQAAGGFEELFEVVRSGADDSVLGDLVDSFGLTKDETIALHQALEVLAGAEQSTIEAIEDGNRARLLAATATSDLEAATREYALALEEAGASVTPFTDASTLMASGLGEVSVAAGIAGEALAGVGDSAAVGVTPIKALQVGLADLAATDVQIMIDVAAADEAALAEQVATVRGLVVSTFGNPWGPRIEDEDIVAYVTRFAEVQAAIEGFSRNLLVIEAANVFTEQEEALLFDGLEAAGKEGGAILAGQLATAIVEGDDETVEAIKAALESGAASAQVTEELNRQTAAIDGTLSFEADIDDRDIREIERNPYFAEFVVDVDDSSLSALERQRLQLQATVDIDRVTQNGQNIDFGFGSGSVPFFDKGGLVDHGGVYTGATFLVAERPGHHEMVAGVHHSDAQWAEWMQELGVAQRVQAELNRRMGAEAMYSVPGAGGGGNSLAAELAAIRAELAAIRADTGVMAADGGRHLPAIAGSVEAGAKATQRLADRRRSVGRQDGWRP